LLGNVATGDSKLERYMILVLMLFKVGIVLDPIGNTFVFWFAGVKGVPSLKPAYL